ncbi:MAG TPA: CRISPR-associated helicase Cas3' [Thermogutta sp.]|nr:CRISPR-associated helicase Cas3' [Thermogutta sp.]
MQNRCFWAHSANDGGKGVPERLRDHLERVALRAKEFASSFEAGEQAQLAGILHDLGKYADKFQQYLEGKVQRAGDHWSAGSLLALKLANKYGECPALAVLAHHSGLNELPGSYKQFWNDLCSRIRRGDEVTESHLDKLWQRLCAEGVPVPTVSSGLVLQRQHLVADMLDVRMLLSALVDADYLETAAHFDGDSETPYRVPPAGPVLETDKAIEALEIYLEELRVSRKEDPLNPLRDRLQGQCRRTAQQPQGLYTLSAPTGLGKTIAMLIFALHHARKHNLRRIILVMPYINIIDQTAQIYRKIFSVENGFPENFVLEHHSLKDDSSDESNEQDSTQRLLAENWDAPIILTTNVQFFESLFANRPSRCRKLHRIARSVVLFDEVQTLPVSLAVVTLAVLSRLADQTGPYHCTCVFATATQPAFTVLHERVKEYAPAGWQPVEIVSNPQELFQATASRVVTTWRHEHVVTMKELAEELAGHSQVLCIVNLKRHAVELFRHLSQYLPENERSSVLHLSTALCPQHRRNVLNEVNRRLTDEAPLRLIATQCVEAGVDLDFPVVYRAVAPLEAIAQASGRCNRHGRRHVGNLIVFRPADDRDPYPPGYGHAAEATCYYLRQLARDRPEKLPSLLADPDGIREYFEVFYSMQGLADRSGILYEERELERAIRAGNFEMVATYYRLISQQTIHILVPYEEERFKKLLEEIEQGRGKPGFIRRWCRQAASFTVDIFPPKKDSPSWYHLNPIEFFHSRQPTQGGTDWYYLLPGVTDVSQTLHGLAYHPQLGLVLPEGEICVV